MRFERPQRSAVSKPSALAEAIVQEAARQLNKGCLWPAPYNEDTPEAATAFIFDLCRTWDEAGRQVREFPDHEYIRESIREWHQSKQSGQTLIFHKSRRLVISWLLCALDVWDGGIKRSNIVQGGINYDKASDFVWRCWFVYTEAAKRIKLPEISKWGNPQTQRLDMVALENGTIIEHLNSDGESFRGSGYGRVKLEEFSSYRYIGVVAAQASAVTQGVAGEAGGQIVAVCNHSLNTEFLKMIEHPDPEYEAKAPDFDAYTSTTGKRVVRIHYRADPTKDAEWVLREKQENMWTDDMWLLEMEMQSNAAQGALWSMDDFRRTGFRLPKAIYKADGKVHFDIPKGVTHICIGVDPNVTDPEMRKHPTKTPDECGIVVVGKDRLKQALVLGDFTGLMKPDVWAKLAWELYFAIKGLYPHISVKICAETNQGGELVRTAIKQHGTFNYEPVKATESKRARAEPVAVKYKMESVFHCGTFPSLESQMVSWNPQNPGVKSPNGIDALVWAFHGLGLCLQRAGTVENMRGESQERSKVFEGGANTSGTFRKHALNRDRLMRRI